MARSVIKLTEEENIFFHDNYAYMWKKLNTAPYYVSGFGEIPSWIKNEESLPSYVNLSKCMNRSYVPSMNLVNKIIAFYNYNITPGVDAYQFLHEKLEDTDAVRNAATENGSKECLGVYYGYYYAGLSEEKVIYGALIYIFEDGNDVTVRLITGLTCDEDLHSEALLKLITSSNIAKEDYARYRNSLPLSKRRIAFFYGNAKSVPGLVTFNLQSVDHDGVYMTMRLPINSGGDEEFIGSLGIAMLFSGETDISLLKFGIVSADHKEVKPFSLGDSKLLALLKIIKEENEHIKMSLSENTNWIDYIIRNSD